jgi:hypothetical protein
MSRQAYYINLVGIIDFLCFDVMNHEAIDHLDLVLSDFDRCTARASASWRGAS